MTGLKVRLVVCAFSLLFSGLVFPQSTLKVTSVEEEKEEGKTSCGGVERWSVKVLTDAAASTINFTPVATTISSLVSMATPPPNANMPRYSSVEDQTYSVVCTISIKKYESDNDYHLVLSDGVNKLIGEVPDPYCSSASSSSFVGQYISARNFVDKYIAFGNVYNVSLPPVVVYGVAFIDPPHGQTGAAPNNIEIHPILDIRFLDPTVVGLSEKSKVLSVAIFPNPASDKLNIEISSGNSQLETCEFMIYDVQGQVVKTITLPHATFNLNTSVMINDLKPGLFYYRITKEGKPFYDGKFTKP